MAQASLKEETMGGMFVSQVGGRESQAAVLVVDDERAIRNCLSQMLERLGYKVYEATGGAEAVGVYTEVQDEICVVLMDMSMPGMGGEECLAHLQEENPDVRVLFVSGADAALKGQDLMALGVTGVVQKPFRMRDLAATLRACLAA